MILLIISLVALLIGPLTFHFLRPNTVLLHILDGFVLVAVSGLVLFHLLPHSVALGGVGAAVAAAGGLLIPLILEHHEPGTSRGLGFWALPAIVGISIHAFMDGAALISHAHGDHHTGEVLPLVVVLHRIPVGLAIWWVVRPAVGSAQALGMVALIAGMTIAGYVGAATSVQGLNLGGLAIFQALVGGLLLHIVFQHQISTAPQKRSRLGEGLGALLAVALLLALITGEPSTDGEGLEAGTIFIFLARQSAPALLAGILGAGLLRAFFGDKCGKWLASARRWGSILKGVAVGLPGISIGGQRRFPLQAVLLQGASSTGALSAVFSARLLGLPAILLTLPLLGHQVMLERLILSGILGIVVSLLLSFVLAAPPQEALRLAEEEDARPAAARRCAGRVVINIYSEFRSAFLPILAGLILTSVVEPMVPGDLLAGLGQGLDVLLLALTGSPGYVSSITSTMLATLFLRKGATLGGAMAFMITGPTLSVTTLKTISELWGRRGTWCMGAVVPCLAVMVGLLINLWTPTELGGLLQRGEDPPALIGWATLAVLGLLSLYTLMQSGLRRMLAEINH